LTSEDREAIQDGEIVKKEHKIQVKDKDAPRKPVIVESEFVGL